MLKIEGTRARSRGDAQRFAKCGAYPRARTVIRRAPSNSRKAMAASPAKKVPGAGSRPNYAFALGRLNGRSYRNRQTSDKVKINSAKPRTRRCFGWRGENLYRNQCETNFRPKCLGFLKCRKNQAERRRAIDFLFFVGWSEPREGLGTYSIASVACGGDIAHAAVNNKRMVPIVAREVDTDTVPEALRKSGTNQRWLNGCVLMRFSPSQGSAQVLC